MSMNTTLNYSPNFDIKKRKPNTPIIVFPRNVGARYTEYIYKHIDCISVGEDITNKEIETLD